MIMEGPLTETSDPGYTDYRRRPALRGAFTVSIKALEQVPPGQRPLQMNDPTHSATAHVAANIARWRSYLPEDCVTAMISAGWTSHLSAAVQAA
jgi:hypothetical protein